MRNPSIIIAMDPVTRALRIETWRNGMRQVIAMPEGDPELAMMVLRGELHSQLDALRAQAQREADRDASEARAKHRRVFEITAQRHGVGFALRTVGDSADGKGERGEREATLFENQVATARILSQL